MLRHQQLFIMAVDKTGDHIFDEVFFDVPNLIEIFISVLLEN